jgi:hypothetical protein
MTYQQTDVPTQIAAPYGYVVTLIKNNLLYGTHANRPLASVPPDGALYFETDTTTWYQVQSLAWAQVSPATASAHGAPVLIASNGATANEKLWAVLTGGAVCTGANDQTVLNGYGGNVALSSGTFYIQGTWTPPANSRILGCGTLTVINFDNGANSYISTQNHDNIEMGNFATSGTHHAGGDRYPIIVWSDDGTTHSNYYFHDIYCSDLGALGDFVIWVTNAGSNLANIIFEKIKCINPDGFGFYNNGGTAGNTISNLIYDKCYVQNAGVAATRSNIWATGFDLAEAGVLTITHVKLIDCVVNGAWESGFHIEMAPTKIDVQFSNCSAYNCGQKTAGLFQDHNQNGTYTGLATGTPITMLNKGTIQVTQAGTFGITPLTVAQGGSISTLIYSGTATVTGSPVYCPVGSTTAVTVTGTGTIKYKGGSDFGAGFCCSGDVTLTSCNSYDNYHDLLLDGTGTSNVQCINFKGYRAISSAIVAGSGVSGDVYKMIGGGIYNSIGNAVVLNTLTPTHVLFQGMEFVGITDDTGSGYALGLLSNNVTVALCYLSCPGLIALYSSVGTGIQILNNQIPASSTPVYMTNAAVQFALVVGNNTKGSSAEINLAGSTTPRVHDNIAIAGGWLAET